MSSRPVFDNWTLDKLIRELQSLRAQYGDLPVVVDETDSDLAGRPITRMTSEFDLTHVRSGERRRSPAWHPDQWPEDRDAIRLAANPISLPGRDA